MGTVWQVNQIELSIRKETDGGKDPLFWQKCKQEGSENIPVFESIVGDHGIRIQRYSFQS